jgi:Fe2+ or Zn2+ uptake regulation protein
MTELDLPSRLAEAGLRVTPQRLALLDLLIEERGHLTADDLYRRARATIPGLSATSIYKSLHALREAGLVREVHVRAGPVRYDANVGRQHHHCVCRRCGRVDDVPCSSAATGGCVVPHEFGDYLVDQVEVTYRGLCAACQSTSASSSPISVRERGRTHD